MPTFSRDDLDTLTAILRDAARAEIMPRFRRLGAGAVRAKTGPLDLVTDADEAAERRITAALHARFPGCVVVGEEATAADPSLLGRIEGAPLAFVVDPVDGTANFAAGLPLFGTMAAAIVGGETVAAAIHDPVGDDTALALRGQGAWTERPDGTSTELRVAAPVPAGEMTGTAVWRHLPHGQRETVAANLVRVAASFDLRCAAHQYRLLGAGHCHFVLFHKLMPWDHAPGVLLQTEAGGHAARFDGSSYRPTSTQGGLICAPDEASFRAIRTALLDI